MRSDGDGEESEREYNIFKGYLRAYTHQIRPQTW